MVRCDETRSRPVTRRHHVGRRTLISEGPTEAGAASGAGEAMDTHRLEAFSDGVMAVIITIMAFELKTPVTASVHGLVNRVPSLLVYVLSFTVVGIYWNNHHHLLRATERINGGVMWTNLAAVVLVVAYSLRHRVGRDGARPHPARCDLRRRCPRRGPGVLRACSRHFASEP